MKNSLFLTLILSCSSFLILDSCKKSGDVWDDSSNVGSYKRAKERVLWGTSNDSEIAQSDFQSSFKLEDDFIPLQDDDLKQQFSETVFMQAKDSPGESDSMLPGIRGFQSPSGSLSSIFTPIHFNTDEYSLKNSESQAALNKAASYLKEHKKTYVFVEGHCDQRGPEAYNLSLGSRRSNAVRTYLIQQGVSPEQIYTISYGKEKLQDLHNTPEAWKQNRRAQFKIYTQK